MKEKLHADIRASDTDALNRRVNGQGQPLHRRSLLGVGGSGVGSIAG
jgi:hypothetical protein